MHTNIRFDHQLLAVEGEHDVHCMLELDAPAAPPTDRAPLHLALVVDRSGSMQGDKLAAARDAARFLASHLRPTDELALVAFDDEVELVAPLAPADPARLAAAIATIDARGLTNLSGGWLKGLEELNRASGDGVRRVLLLTDGQANEGITDRTQLEQIAAGTRARAGTTTVGFGEGFDEELLTAIAEHSNGNTYFAASPEDAPGIFAEEFEGLATLVAQNVSVEIRPAESVELLGVLNDYPIVEVPGGAQAQLGDAFGGERRRLVFAMHVPQLAALGPARIADVVLRYVAVGDEVAAHELTLPVTVNLVSADEAAVAELDAEVNDEIWLLRAARARNEAIADFDDGDYEAGSNKMLGIRDLLLSAAPQSSRGDELLAEAASLAESADVHAMDDPMWRKRNRNLAWRRQRGR